MSTKSYTPTVTTKGGVTFKACGCGCLAIVSSRATFRPGHDARMVSQAVKDSVLATESHSSPFAVTDPGVDIERRIQDTGNTIEAAFGRALAIKYDQAARSAWVKAVGTDKAPKAAKRNAKITGTVKVGRWTYPAETTPGAQSVRYLSKQGTWLGSTSAKVVASFVADQG